MGGRAHAFSTGSGAALPGPGGHLKLPHLFHRLADGTRAHSFRTLLDELSTIVRNTCRSRGSSDDARTFELVTTPNEKQARAMQLLQAISL